MNRMKIGVIGVGMVGSPLARYFEDVKGYRRGEDLFLFDRDPAKGFFDDVNHSDIVFVVVPTPRAASGAADTNIVESVIAEFRSPKIIVVKSTVSPGTTERLQKKFPAHRFLFNPEFLTEKRAWDDFIRPDRQLVGWTAESRSVAKEILELLPAAPVSSPSEDLDLTATEAEIVKYAGNVFLSRKVVFANAIYDIAVRNGSDYENIRKAFSADSRIGDSHLDVHHGGYRGYGGYCFVKDTDGLIAHAEELGLERVRALLSADRAYNEEILAEQGLTPEDVSVHDHECIARKLAHTSPRPKTNTNTAEVDAVPAVRPLSF